ncbi:hypothetical protein MPLDJ20_10024 [Mesorhizobium plurifarium]|uniref:Uncharacterized protein n=1 Tax=Mesorhizobium plurifarium TaxID=69974 RepID=A0A090DGP6_MESPL|nr:hypothetical protein MPLDJ20_10024 [Mesorhizobium plurifarium]
MYYVYSRGPTQTQWMISPENRLG